MKVSRKWLEWAHEPGAEDGQPVAIRLCEIATGPGRGSVEISAPELIEEIVSVAECYQNPSSGDALYEMGPWWMSQPGKIIRDGRAALRAAQK